MSELNNSPSAVVCEQRFVACLDRLGVHAVRIGPQRFAATVQGVSVGLYCYDAPYAVCVHCRFDDCAVPALSYGAALEWVNETNLDMAFVSGFVAPLSVETTSGGASDVEPVAAELGQDCGCSGQEEKARRRSGEYVVSAYASMLTVGGVTDEQLDASVATAIEAMVDFSARFEVFYRELLSPED